MTIIRMCYLGFFLWLFIMASTDPDVSGTEAETCYSEQRRLEEELLAGGAGDEEQGDVNPSLLDMSTDDAGAEGGGEPNPIKGGKPNPQSVDTLVNPTRGVLVGSQSLDDMRGGGGISPT
jgi:hypothetical protein